MQPVDQCSSLLEVKDLSVCVKSYTLVDQMTFHLFAGKIVALLGHNGAGKTTFLSTIAGLTRGKIKGSIVLNGKDISRTSLSQRVEQGILLLPQHHSLFLDLTARENIFLVFSYHKEWKGKKEELFWKEAAVFLEQSSLYQSLDIQALRLSGGQKRLLEVVRSFLCHPRILLLDEPFAGLDPKTIFRLIELFKKAALSGLSLVISDHNIWELLPISDYVYVMEGGKCIAHGSSSVIQSDTYVCASYLGRAQNKTCA